MGKLYYIDDEAAAEGVYAMLTDTYMGELYGQDAADAYSENPESMLFNCFFIHDMQKLTVNGDVFSGVDADGNELFSHTYHYVGSRPVTFYGEEMDTQLRLYKTEDEDAGGFTWFAFSDDNLADTQHIEFRYGKTDIAITDYTEGSYAYWLASGIADGYKDSLIQTCIQLFVDENLGEAAAASDDTASDTDPDAIAISTAEELAAINDNLSGHYVLAADIDLEGAEWLPIGAFVPSGESEEEAELPDPEYAFTGTFDGNGHTISNLVIQQPEDYALGLFGCAANAKIGNFTIENAQIEGAMMISAGIGYANQTEVYDVTLLHGDIKADMTEFGTEGMISGIGGVTGCAFGAETLEDCLARRVTIIVGDNAYLVGGIVGYTGGYEEEEYGVPVTNVNDCIAEGVSITTGENPVSIRAVVGGGFYFEEVAQEYGGAYENPTVFVLNDCESATMNGEAAPLTGAAE